MSLKTAQDSEGGSRSAPGDVRPEQGSCIDPRAARDHPDMLASRNPASLGSASRPRRSFGSILGVIGQELRAHAPFTLVGALTGIAIMLIVTLAGVPRSVSAVLFWGTHPLHVVLSALVTAGIYRRHSIGKLWRTILIGYFGSIGIATFSDCVIPYIGESLLDLPNRAVHLGFIEKWWLVNPLAGLGIAIACYWPRTKFPHAGHVLLSTWASLFHMTMALGDTFSLYTLTVIPVFLFLAVWIPCCTSDIVFPLLFSKE